MVDTSPLPPNIHKWNQNVLDKNAVICTHIRPIASQSQMSIIHPIIALINKLKLIRNTNTSVFRCMSPMLTWRRLASSLSLHQSMGTHSTQGSRETLWSSLIVTQSFCVYLRLTKNIMFLQALPKWFFCWVLYAKTGQILILNLMSKVLLHKAGGF